jgi:hypothetical protein
MFRCKKSKYPFRLFVPIVLLIIGLHLVAGMICRANPDSQVNGHIKLTNIVGKESATMGETPEKRQAKTGSKSSIKAISHPEGTGNLLVRVTGKGIKAHWGVQAYPAGEKPDGTNRIESSGFELNHYVFRGLKEGDYVVMAPIPFEIAGVNKGTVQLNGRTRATVEPGKDIRAEIDFKENAGIRGVFQYPDKNLSWRIILLDGADKSCGSSSSEITQARALGWKLERSGFYEINYLPPGTYTIIGRTCKKGENWIPVEEKKKTVTVGEGEVAVVDFNFPSEPVLVRISTSPALNHRSKTDSGQAKAETADIVALSGEEGKVLAFDDFNGSLNLDWEILHANPTYYSLTKKPGMLTITTQKGGFAWSGTDYDNLFLIDCPALPSSGVQITTCISGFNPEAPWQQAGLIFWNDDDNYLKWVCQFGTERTFSYLGETNAIRESHRSFAVGQGVDRYWLRMTKQGDRYQFLTSKDGKSFVPFNARTDPHGTPMTGGTLPWGNGSVEKIGLFVGNGSNSQAPEIDASFEFFEVRIFQAEAEPQSESIKSEETGRSQASTLQSSSKEEAGKRYQNDLNAFFSEIDRTYPFFDLKNIRKDWGRAKERLTILVGKCESDSEFMRILLDATKCLRDSHVRIFNNSIEIPWPAPEYYPLIGFMPAQGNTVVVMMSPPGKEGSLPVGTVVKTIDGVNARQYLDARAKEAWETGGHPSPQRARLFAYRIPLKGAKGTKHKIMVQRQDEEEEIALECTKEARGWPHTYNMPAELVRVGRSFSYTKLPSGVGYMYLRRVDTSVTQGISEAVKSHPDVRGWIVDLRGNGGGGYGSELIQMIKFLPRPAAALIDAGCMSAGETLARDVRRNAGARLFGSKTAGSSSAKRSWQFPSGIASVIIPTRSRWRADRKPIEYNGIEPDEKIEASSEDLLKGLNTGILRAEEYIRSQASNVARYQKNVMEKEESIFDFEIDQKYTIPEKNLELTEQLDDCAKLLKQMYSAIANFEAEQGQLPNWLSELVPKYLGAKDLLCPNDQTHQSRYYRDPKMPCSYTYEFCKTTALPGLDQSQNSTTRSLKMKQIKVFGDVLPVVRCHKHEGKVLNLAVSGEIYWSSLNWERLFEPGYRFRNLTSN